MHSTYSTFSSCHFQWTAPWIAVATGLDKIQLEDQRLSHCNSHVLVVTSLTHSAFAPFPSLPFPLLSFFSSGSCCSWDHLIFAHSSLWMLLHPPASLPSPPSFPFLSLLSILPIAVAAADSLHVSLSLSHKHTCSSGSWRAHLPASFLSLLAATPAILPFPLISIAWKVCQKVFFQRAQLHSHRNMHSNCIYLGSENSVLET